MIKQKIYFVIILTLILTNVNAQSINQLDSNGERHGLWKKNFEGTDQPRYEGTFDHGKEVGIFKFYKLVEKKSKLSATREFNPNDDTIIVKFYASTGKLISEGMMRDKLFIGKWVYYHNKSKGILSTEFYNNKGLLEGEKFVYYEDGKIAEKSIYVDGKIDGISTWYSPKGIVVKEFTYKNGLLHGLSKYYNEKGEILAEGNYKNDQKHGIWKYYEDGKFKEEKDYTTYSKNPIKQ